MVSWLGALELTLGVVACLMAGLVLVGARLRRNRTLALVLLVDGIGWFGISDGMADIWPASAGWSNTVTRLTLAASPWLYAAFAAETLDVPATRWARRTGVRWAFLASAAAAPVLLVVFLDQSAWYQQVNRFIGIISGPHVVIGSWALVAAWQDLRSRGTRQASAYFFAFALRDVALITLFGAALAAKQYDAVAAGFQGFGLVLFFVKLLLLAHLLYLMYAVLSGQVPGLDDQVRATLQKGIVLTLVSAILLVMTEGTEMLVGVDSPVLAILAAGLITLTFQPVQVLAERLAQRLLPGATIDPRLSRKQRLSMYKQQYDIAMMDGHIGPKEASMLERLRTELGLRSEDVQSIERADR